MALRENAEAYHPSENVHGNGLVGYFDLMKQIGEAERAGDPQTASSLESRVEEARASMVAQKQQLDAWSEARLKKDVEIRAHYAKLLEELVARSND